MRRALRLAALGEGTTGSNPMVGAVIAAPDGHILGEGWHRRFGRGHAEVNAVASVANPALLRDSTMYVTLEPCSHYGKTPPCARLIIERGIPRVVVATLDPFEKVSGRGVEMLRNAGVEVEVGMMERESRMLNCRFFTAHTLRRPFIMLKWAQTADGHLHADGGHPLRISTPLTAIEVHRLRSHYLGIMVGSRTVAADNPRLDSRMWHMGQSPAKIILDRSASLPQDSQVFTSGTNTIYFTSSPRQGFDPRVEQMTVAPDASPADIMTRLYAAGVISVMVEGGPSLLNSFISSGLWDVIRRETNPRISLPHTPADPVGPPPASLKKAYMIDGNIIEIFTNNPLVDVKNL